MVLNEKPAGEGASRKAALGTFFSTAELSHLSQHVSGGAAWWETPFHQWDVLIILHLLRVLRFFLALQASLDFSALSTVARNFPKVSRCLTRRYREKCAVLTSFSQQFQLTAVFSYPVLLLLPRTMICSHFTGGKTSFCAVCCAGNCYENWPNSAVSNYKKHKPKPQVKQASNRRGETDTMKGKLEQFSGEVKRGQNIRLITETKTSLQQSLLRSYHSRRSYTSFPKGLILKMLHFSSLCTG